MKVAFFDTHKFDRNVFDRVNQSKLQINYFEPRLGPQNIALAIGYEVICCFVNDHLTEEVINTLADNGLKLIVLRCAGFNNVNLKAAEQRNVRVTRVPKYSPYAVAEHAVALMLCLNRKIHRAFNRVREHNFSLDGLVGHDIRGKTVGILGTGEIGSVLVRIMNGFGCRILAFDKEVKRDLVSNYNCNYVGLKEIFNLSDIISLHLPLSKDTSHLIEENAFKEMKNNVMLINTGRGGLVDSKALLWALKNNQIGYAGLDVYEEEEEVFFKDVSEYNLKDDCLARLLTFPNVIITSHQAFLTCEALENIARSSIDSIDSFIKGSRLENEVTKFC